MEIFYKIISGLKAQGSNCLSWILGDRLLSTPVVNQINISFKPTYLFHLFVTTSPFN